MSSNDYINVSRHRIRDLFTNYESNVSDYATIRADSNEILYYIPGHPSAATLRSALAFTDPTEPNAHCFFIPIEYHNHAIRFQEPGNRFVFLFAPKSDVDTAYSERANSAPNSFVLNRPQLGALRLVKNSDGTINVVRIQNDALPGSPTDSDFFYGFSPTPSLTDTNDDSDQPYDVTKETVSLDALVQPNHTYTPFEQVRALRDITVYTHKMVIEQRRKTALAIDDRLNDILDEFKSHIAIRDEPAKRDSIVLSPISKFSETMPDIDLSEFSDQFALLDKVFVTKRGPRKIITTVFRDRVRSANYYPTARQTVYQELSTFLDSPSSMPMMISFCSAVSKSIAAGELVYPYASPRKEFSADEKANSTLRLESAKLGRMMSQLATNARIFHWEKQSFDFIVSIARSYFSDVSTGYLLSMPEELYDWSRALSFSTRFHPLTLLSTLATAEVKYSLDQQKLVKLMVVVFLAWHTHFSGPDVSITPPTITLPGQLASEITSAYVTPFLAVNQAKL
ncbi:hypothetical protein [Sclerotinia sclerotiorum reovirus 1]|nr:hypothetical protein [Sclerotinia sclerotiorum reovirus 1]